MTNTMPKDTEVEILYSDLKKLIGEKYEKMKGFKMSQVREIDIAEYLTMLYFHNIDNNTNIKDVIGDGELEHLKNDNDVRQILNRIKNLMLY